MPADTHEISFGYKHSLKNWWVMGDRGHLNLFSSTKIQEQSDFSGTEYVLQSIKCTTKNVYWKKGSHFRSK